MTFPWPKSRSWKELSVHTSRNGLDSYDAWAISACWGTGPSLAQQILQGKAGHDPDRNSRCHNMGGSFQSGSRQKVERIQGSAADEIPSQAWKYCLPSKTGPMDKIRKPCTQELCQKDLWETEGGRLSHIIRAIYDVLPSAKNLNQSLGIDPSCLICQTPAHTVLICCKTSLIQGHNTWRHNQFLQQLALVE